MKTIQSIMYETGCSRATAYRIRNGGTYHNDYHTPKPQCSADFDVSKIEALVSITSRLGVYLISDPAIDIEDVQQELRIAGWKVSGKSMDRNFLITVFKRKINDLKKGKHNARQIHS
jgi:hypothetical protein